MAKGAQSTGMPKDRRLGQRSQPAAPDHGRALLLLRPQPIRQAELPAQLDRRRLLRQQRIRSCVNHEAVDPLGLDDPAQT